MGKKEREREREKAEIAGRNRGCYRHVKCMKWLLFMERLSSIIEAVFMFGHVLHVPILPAGSFCVHRRGVNSKSLLQNQI